MAALVAAMLVREPLEVEMAMESRARRRRVVGKVGTVRVTAEAVERLEEEVGKRRAVGEVLRSDAADGWLGRGSGGGGDGGGGI